MVQPKKVEKQMQKKISRPKSGKGGNQNRNNKLLFVPLRKKENWKIHNNGSKKGHFSH